MYPGRGLFAQDSLDIYRSKGTKFNLLLKEIKIGRNSIMKKNNFLLFKDR